MKARKRQTGNPKRRNGTPGVGRKGPFGNILRDDPYTAQMYSLLRKARSTDVEEARMALMELFHRFRLRLPLEEARLSSELPWQCQPLRN